MDQNKKRFKGFAGGVLILLSLVHIHCGLLKSTDVPPPPEFLSTAPNDNRTADDSPPDITPSNMDPNLATRIISSNCETPQMIAKGNIQILSSSEVQIDGMVFDRTSPRECFDTAKIYYGNLSKNTKIQDGVVPAGSFVMFFKVDGNLKYAEIPYPIDLNNKKFEAGSLFHFFPENEKSLENYKNKLQIQGAFSAQAITVEGVTCRPFVSANYKVSFPIYFFNSGELESCYLSGAQSIGNVGFANHFWIHFYPLDSTNRKQVKLGVLQEPTLIQGVPCDSHPPLPPNVSLDAYSYNNIFFHANGVLGGATLSQDLLMDGVLFKKGSILCFDAQRKFKGKVDSIWGCTL